MPAAPQEEPSQVDAAPELSGRLQMLHSLGILGSEPEAIFDGITEAASAITGYPVAMIALADQDRLWLKAKIGWDKREIPLTSSAFCLQVVASHQPLKVTDATSDQRFATDPLVTDAPWLRAYAGHPILVGGECVGTLCVLDLRSRDLDAPTFALLGRLADAAAELLSSRRHAAELERERERLVDFARASGDWVWETDAGHRICWLSESFESTTGIRRGDAIGRVIVDAPIVDSLGNPDPQGRSLHQMLSQRQRLRRLLTVQGSPESPSFISYSALPSNNAEGQFIGYRGVARDLTTQVAAERAAHHRDTAIRATMSLLPGAVVQYVEYPDGRRSVPYASEKFVDLFGITAAQAMATGIDVTQHVDPLQLAAGVAGRQRSVALGIPWRGEYRLNRPGSSERWVDVHAMPERLADGGVLWHTFLADITRQRATRQALERTRERWAMAAAVASIGVIEIDLGNGRMHLDRIACEHLGYAEGSSELSAAHCFRRVLASDRRILRERITSAALRRQTFDDAFRFRHPDGGERFIAVIGQTYFDAAGRPTHLLCTSSDKTEQRRASQLALDKEAAERANRAKTEFLSRVSHELRTPLHGILGFAQLMALDQQAPLSAGQSERLTQVLDSGRHLLDLINDMLDLSRIESGRLSLNLVALDPRALLMTVGAALRPIASSRAISIDPPAETGPGPQVLGDRRAIEQILVNLISNAIKYNRDAGRVSLSVEHHADRVLITIGDNGRGLTETELGQLFLPFNRLGAERTRTEGTGLGLAIARQLAQAMDGDITVKSTVGEGSQFTIDLPAAARTPTPVAVAPGLAGIEGQHPVQSDDATIRGIQAAGANPNAGSAPSAPAPNPSRRILYIEDDAFNRLLLAQLFADRPHWQLDLADTLAQGIALARLHPPDLILADMNLPDGHGIDLIAGLKAQAGTRPVRPTIAALSADALPEQVDAALQAGFDRYWTKPVDLAALMAWLDQKLA